MAKKKEDIMIKIRDDNPEYNFVREDFLPDTGRVVLIPEWNFRNSKCEIPEGADLIDFCIKKAMQNNKNYKEILDDLVENEYSNTDYQRPKVLDIVDVAKAGASFTKFIEKFYKMNKKMVAVLNEAKNIIRYTKNNDEMEKKLRALRGRFFVLVGGYTRISIFLRKDVKIKGDNKHIRAVCLPLANPFYNKDLLVRSENVPLEKMQHAVELTIRAMIAADNKGTSRSMEGLTEEYAITNFARTIREYDLSCGSNETFDTFYDSFGMLFNLCGFTKKKVLTSIMSVHSVKAIKTNNKGEMRSQKSLITGSFEPFFASDKFSGKLTFISSNAFEILDKKEAERVFDEIIRIRNESLNKAIKAINGDGLAPLIKEIISEIDDEIDADRMIAILRSAEKKYYDQWNTLEQLEKERSKNKRTQQSLDELIRMAYKKNVDEELLDLLLRTRGEML